MLATVLFTTLFFATTSTATTCYNSQGKPWAFNPSQPVEGWVPCNSTASVTNCCGPRDYCLSNGLCLDAVMENMMTQQGCTSSTWDTEPCQNYCGKTNTATDAGLHFIWRCDNEQHCCGHNRTMTCCNDPGVDKFLLNVGQNIHMPDTVQVPLSSLPKTASQTSSSSTTPTNQTSLPPAQASQTSQTQSDPTAASKPDNTTATIGIAIGVALGVVFIAAVMFFGWQLRKRNKNMQRAEEVFAKPELGSHKGVYQPGFNQVHGYSNSHPYEPTQHALYGQDFKSTSPPVEIADQLVRELPGSRYSR